MAPWINIDDWSRNVRRRHLRNLLDNFYDEVTKDGEDRQELRRDYCLDPFIKAYERITSEVSK